MMVIENKYEIGQIVYLVTDIDQRPGVITGLQVTNGGIMYRMVRGTEETYHYDFEISEKENELTKIKG